MGKDNLSEQIKKHFVDWQEKPDWTEQKGDNVFVRDGVIDEDEWMKLDGLESEEQKGPKVLYILKESYGWQELKSDSSRVTNYNQLKNENETENETNIICLSGDKKYVDMAGLLSNFNTVWDIDKEAADNQEIKGVGASKTWYRLAEWQKGIRGTDAEKIPPYEAFKVPSRNPGLNEVPSYEVKKFLRTCAFLNLKKSSGKSHSKDTNFSKELNNTNVAAIKREIELIDPDVIICCGTFDLIGIRRFRKIVLPSLKCNENNKMKYKRKETKAIKDDGFCIVTLEKEDEKVEKQVIVLNTPHPAAPISAFFSYYGVCALYQQALKALQAHGETENCSG